eukprot:3417416-Pyramimonas_sp.AAC.1
MSWRLPKQIAQVLDVLRIFPDSGHHQEHAKLTNRPLGRIIWACAVVWLAGLQQRDPAERR